MYARNSFEITVVPGPSGLSLGLSLASGSVSFLWSDTSYLNIVEFYYFFLTEIFFKIKKKIKVNRVNMLNQNGSL